MEFKVSGSGVESKTADIARLAQGPFDSRVKELVMCAVEKCEEEVLSGLKLNPHDLWLYCTAMRVLTDALKRGMDEGQHNMYTNLMDRLESVTIVADVTNEEER